MASKTTQRRSSVDDFCNRSESVQLSCVPKLFKGCLCAGQYGMGLKRNVGFCLQEVGKKVSQGERRIISNSKSEQSAANSWVAGMVKRRRELFSLEKMRSASPKR